MSDIILRHAMELGPAITEWCRKLTHLSREDPGEERSAGFLRSQLEEIGLSCSVTQTNETKTCIEGALSGHCITLCADGTAFPSQERTLSSVQAAVALGAAALLQKYRKQIAGKVVVLFPHRENDNLTPSGMRNEETVRSDGAIGFLPIVSLKEPPLYGQVCFCPGNFTPCLDQWEFTVEGKGGHGAYPHNCIDPVPPACRIAETLQTIISREKNPVEPAGITIEEIRTESGAFNIIADECVVKGTARSCSEMFRERMRRRIEEVARGIASLAGAGLKFDYRTMMPVLHNSPDMTMEVMGYAREILGRNSVTLMSEGLGESVAFAEWDHFPEKTCATVFFPPTSADRIAATAELWRLSAFAASAAIKWLSTKSGTSSVISPISGNGEN